MVIKVVELKKKKKCVKLEKATLPPHSHSQYPTFAAICHRQPNLDDDDVLDFKSLFIISTALWAML